MVYFYTENVSIDPGKNVILEIEFIDAATEGSTFITLPGGNVIEIPNAGSVDIGNLPPGTSQITITSSIYNLAKEVDVVQFNIKINGAVVVPHSNPKEEDETPTIDTTINFQ